MTPAHHQSTQDVQVGEPQTGDQLDLQILHLTQQSKQTTECTLMHYNGNSPLEHSAKLRLQTYPLLPLLSEIVGSSHC